ncbi:hypothetical protein PENTCL1PPCAC_14934, partial [Pristionchus entomophagus]
AYVFATIAVGYALDCPTCPYSEEAVENCKGGNFQLSCLESTINGISDIKSGKYDDLTCIGGKWYGTSGDGKAAVFGQNVAVSCPEIPTSTTTVPHTTTKVTAPPELLIKEPSKQEYAHACGWRYYSNQADLIQDTCDYTDSEKFNVMISCKNGRKGTIPGYTGPHPVNMKGVMCI